MSATPGPIARRGSLRIDRIGLKARIRLEDGVGVTQQQEVSRLLGCDLRFALGHDQWAGARVLAVGVVERGTGLDRQLEAERLQSLGDERRERLEAGRVPGSGVPIDPVGEQLLHLLLLLREQDADLDVLRVELRACRRAEKRDERERGDPEAHSPPHPRILHSAGRARTIRRAMRTGPRVSIPITLTVAIVAITVVLTVGWQILVVREFEAFAEGFTAIHWSLLILGSIFFALIITVLILQAVWLVREIRSNQRQQTFMDAVTHELHTPLASLRLYLDTLRGRSLPESRREEFLEIMADDLERLQRTIDQILSAARTDLKRVLRDPVDIGELLASCAADTRDRFDLDEKAISLEVPPGARVKGDAEQLRVAFRNLIDNAARYAGSDVRVNVRVRPISTRKLEIEVADLGVGIPASALDRVFQRFSRLPQEAVRAARGLGLGLFIVRNVARAHGGNVRAESEGEGKGSRFILTLPGNVDGRTRPRR